MPTRKQPRLLEICLQQLTLGSNNGRTKFELKVAGDQPGQHRKLTAASESNLRGRSRFCPRFRGFPPAPAPLEFLDGIRAESATAGTRGPRGALGRRSGALPEPAGREERRAFNCRAGRRRGRLTGQASMSRGWPEGMWSGAWVRWSGSHVGTQFSRIEVEVHLGFCVGRARTLRFVTDGAEPGTKGGCPVRALP